MKITFIGGGNMAAALISGLRKRGFSAAAIQVVEPDEEARERLTEAFGVRCAPTIDAAALHCHVLILAVKPQQMKDAVSPAAGKLTDQLVVSIAAGLRMDDIGRWLGGYGRLVRAMPNTPALVGAGVTGLCAAPEVDQPGRDVATKILGAVGQTLWIEDEALMDVVTALSGSGPAYVFYFLEALEQVGTELGLSPKTARELAIETFAGAARLAASSEEPLAALRARVTSKGGTTAAAIEAFDSAGVGVGISQGVIAAARRGGELSRVLGAS